MGCGIKRKSGYVSMSVIEVAYTVGLTVAGSIAIAYTTLRLQDRQRSRRLRNSLRHEISANLSGAKSNLESISALDRKGERESKGEWTYFDILPLRIISYQDSRLSGEGGNLGEEIRAKLDEVYELINAHNRQVSFMTVEFIPRTRGMAERLQLIIEKLNSLYGELGKGRKWGATPRANAQHPQAYK